MESGWIVAIIIFLVVLGFYGGIKTEEANYSCDIGAEGTFCLWWHKTAVGEINEIFNEMGMEDFLG